MNDISRIAKENGIFINYKKTQIVKIPHGFTWLKTRYILTSSGKIIKKMPKDSITRERRKLKSLSRFVEDGLISEQDIWLHYKSWRGNATKYNAYFALKNMDKLYRRLANERKRNRNQDKIEMLKNELSSNNSEIGDYKITKIYEVRLKGRRIRTILAI